MTHAIGRLVGIDRHVLIEPSRAVDSTAGRDRCDGSCSSRLLILQVSKDLTALARPAEKGLLLLLQHVGATVGQTSLTLKFGLKFVEICVETSNVLVEHFIGLRSESDLLGGVLLRRLDLSADFSQLSVFLGRIRSILATTFMSLDKEM